MSKPTPLHARIIAMLALVSIVASSAINARAQSSTPTSLPPVKPADVKGDISVGGSGTVLPLSEVTTKQFVAAGYKGKINLIEDGTSAGIKRFCNGDHDMIGISRPLKSAEIEACKKSNRATLEMKVGIDALIFVVSRNNRFVDKVTKQQLQEIWSGKITTWKQIDPRWPNIPIALFAPTQAHGTYEFASEQLFADVEKDSAARKEIIASVKDINLQAQYREMTNLIYKNPLAMGFVSYSYYNTQRTKLRVISVDGVMANDKTIPLGDYKLTRSISIVTSPSILRARPHVSSFVNFYLSNLPENVLKSGYFPQPEKITVEVQKSYLDAIK
jgi:phosphate binding protein